MRKCSILITGAEGLLGSTLKIFLKEQGHTTSLFEGDIRDEKDIERYIKYPHRFHYIIHTAALTNVNECEENHQACFATNVQGTRNIRDIASQIGAHLLYISTASVFSGMHGNYKESDIPYPKNFYNLSKLLGEETVLSYNKGMVIRLNLIGIHPNGSRGKNFFEWVTDSLKKNRDLKLFTDVRINPLSSWTIAEYIGQFIEKKISEKILHIGTRVPSSKANIVKMTVKHFPAYSGKLEFISVDNLIGAERPKEIWLNVSYIEEKFGIKMPAIEDEIEKIIKKTIY